MSTDVEREAEEVADSESKPPFLRRVRIRGYKSIEFCDVSLEPLTIFVGRNAAGKSNFLDALAFMRDAMETNIPEAVRRHGGWASIRSRVAASNRIAFEVEVEFFSGQGAEGNGAELTTLSNVNGSPESTLRDAPQVAIYGFEIEVGFNDQPVLACEHLRFQDSRRYQGIGFDFSDGKLSYRRETMNHFGFPIQAELNHYRTDHLLLSTAGTRPFVDVAARLRFMGFYNFDPKSIRLPQRPNPGAMLDREGQSLAGLLDSLQKLSPSTMNRINSYLSSVVPEIAHCRAFRLGEYLTVRFALRSHGGSAPPEFDSSSMSDGTLRALAALVAAFQIHLPFGPTVVGIEEPETALHPAAMRALVDALDEATLNTQVLLTTHSADMLDNPTIRPENVRVVRMIDGRTVIGPVDAASAEIVRRKLDTLGGLERQNQLEPDLDDQDRQQRLARNGTEAAP